MTAVVDDHRELCGVEPICAMLPTARRPGFEQQAPHADPLRLPRCTQRDAVLGREINSGRHANRAVYGARKVWKQMGREDIPAARCTVERLMKKLGLAGAVRGPSFTTRIPDEQAARPADLVQRAFTAPRANHLYVAGLTYVST